MPLVVSQMNPMRPKLHLSREVDGALTCTVSVVSFLSGTEHVVGEASLDAVRAFVRGRLAPHAFPTWTDEQREAVISGMTPAEQAMILGAEDDE